VYTVSVTAELTGLRYIDPTININTELTFQLTIVDPCSTAIVNNFADTTNNRVIRNMETSVLGAPDI